MLSKDRLIDRFILPLCSKFHLGREALLLHPSLSAAWRLGMPTVCMRDSAGEQAIFMCGVVLAASGVLSPAIALWGGSSLD